MDPETVYSYLHKLENAFILHRCSRYDIQGKEILKTQEKFYLADTSFRFSVLGYDENAVAGMLENVVYMELLRILLPQSPYTANHWFSAPQAAPYSSFFACDSILKNRFHPILTQPGFIIQPPDLAKGFLTRRLKTPLGVFDLNNDPNLIFLNLN